MAVMEVKDIMGVRFRMQDRWKQDLNVENADRWVLGTMRTES